MVSFNYQLPEINNEQDTSSYFGPENEYLLRQLNSLLTQKQNIHGRRIGKAKDAISPGDYVTKRQLNGTLVGTLAQRPNPLNVVVGTTYFATDRNVTYIARSGHWYYYSGVQYVTLNPDTRPSPSVLYDDRYIIYATDFNWYYRWNLITWRRMNGTNLFIQGFQVGPGATELGWGLCDGTTYTYSKDDGSTGSIATPNLTGTSKYYLSYSSSSALLSAVAPTISGLTGNQNTNHTHSVIATGSISGTAALPDLSHGHDEGTLSNDSGNLSLSGSVSTGVSGTVTISDSCTQVFPIGEGGSDVVQCGSVSASFFGALNDGSVSFGSGGHTHTISGFTGGALGFTEGGIDITVTATFTGDSVTSGTDSVSHQHSGSSLVVSSNGTPLTVQLIPYIRL
jgi:hypothetical protein